MTYVWSQLRYRPVRELAVIAGVALGAALFVALTALGNGFREAARVPLAGVAADLLITRPSDSEAPSAQRTRGARLPFGSGLLSSHELSEVVATNGVLEAAPALAIWDFGATRYQTVLGVDVTQPRVGPGRAISDGLVSGRVFAAGERGVALADQHYAAFYSLKPGSTMTISAHSFQVIGIVEQPGSSQAGVANLYVPLSEAQRLVGIDTSQINQIYVRVANAGQVEAIVADLTARLGQPLSVISEDSILQVMGGIAGVSTRFAEIAGLVAMIGGWMLAWTAMTGLVAERRHEIGVMKAVGWRARDVMKTFLAESLILSALGALIGIVLGIGAASLLGYLPAPSVALQQSLPGLTAVPTQTVEPHLPAQVTFSILVLSASVAMLGGTMAGWVSARQAALLKPSRMLQDV